MARFNDHGSTWLNSFPSLFSRIKTRVSARDRAWFAAHPCENHYIRPYVPGEFWPALPPSGIEIVVLVSQFASGFRTRQPIEHRLRRSIVPRMDVVDPSSGAILRNVPMEGWVDD